MLHIWISCAFGACNIHTSAAGWQAILVGGTFGTNRNVCGSKVSFSFLFYGDALLLIRSFHYLIVKRCAISPSDSCAHFGTSAQCAESTSFRKATARGSSSPASKTLLNYFWTRRPCFKGKWSSLGSSEENARIGVAGSAYGRMAGGGNSGVTETEKVE